MLVRINPSCGMLLDFKEQNKKRDGLKDMERCVSASDLAFEVSCGGLCLLKFCSNSSAGLHLIF